MLIGHAVPCTRPKVAAMSSDLSHHLGRIGEDAAAAHMERLGYAIVARNHRTRLGELDLVCFRHARSCSSRSRRDAAAGARGTRSVPASRARSGAWPPAYLAETLDRPLADELRFDAIGIVFDARGRLVSLDHLEAAF